MKDAKQAHNFTFSNKIITCYINNIMRFAFITSSFVAFLALADGANPSDRILSETLPTLPEKGEDSPKDIMASPKGVLLDVTKSLSSPYSLKHGGGDDAKKKALGFKKSNGQKVSPPPDLKTKLEPQDIKLKADSDGDRRLEDKNIGGSQKDETKGNLKGLRGIKADTNFMADVAAPVLLANKLSKTPGNDPRRRLQTAECFVQDDGSLACVQLGFPGDGFYTVFVDCPVDSPTVLDCLGCAIFGSSGGEIDPSTDPTCLDCSLCFDSVAYDCSNLGEGDCVAQTCSGACTASDGSDPVPSPTTASGEGSSEGGVSCQEDENGDVFCVKEDYPANDFLTVFLDCPFDTTNALQCGRCAIVPPDDTPLEIDLVNDEQCNSCTVCSDRAAYDCSNLDSGNCSVYDCDGVCSSVAEQTQPSVAPPTVGPSPTVASPTTPPDANPTTPGALNPLLPPSRTSSASITGTGMFGFITTIGSMKVLGLF